MSNDVRTVAEAMYTAFNTHDHQAAHDIFTADFYSHPMNATGPDSVAQRWQQMHKAFPELKVTVEDMVVEGNTAAVRTSVHGIPGQSPTMMEIFRIRDGRIAELWGLSSMQR
ncbi:nuclear transport factor 2 family protein [Spirillospora sp. NPDC052269]